MEESAVARRGAKVEEEEELGEVLERAGSDVEDNRGDMIGEEHMLGTRALGMNAAAGSQDAVRWK